MFKVLAWARIPGRRAERRRVKTGVRSPFARLRLKRLYLGWTKLVVHFCIQTKILLELASAEKIGGREAGRSASCFLCMRGRSDAIYIQEEWQIVHGAADGLGGFVCAVLRDGCMLKFIPTILQSIGGGLSPGVSVIHQLQALPLGLNASRGALKVNTCTLAKKMSLLFWGGIFCTIVVQRSDPQTAPSVKLFFLVLFLIS